MAEPRWWDREPTRPLRVDGGIKARSKRGAIAQTWWSARFIQVLESIGVGGRLGRGRSYARAGQVVTLRTDPGTVTATVQGSRPRPYQVRIGVPTYGKTEWARIEQAMADSAWYAAKLLAGEMPGDIEDVFASVGLALFPSNAGELSMDCGCPDPQVPCKHLAAVCYLLAESFDTDPFGILALRGRDRDTLLDNIKARRAGGSSSGGSGAGSGCDLAPGGVPALVDCLQSYYLPAGEIPAPVVCTAAADAVLDQLPPLDVTVRGTSLVELLRPVYRALADPE